MVLHLRTLEEQIDGFYLKILKNKKKNQIKYSDWYVVKYENTLYPGVVMLVEENEFQTNSSCRKLLEVARRILHFL